MSDPLLTYPGVEPIIDEPPLYGVGQERVELLRMTRLYRRRAPKRVLEIGSQYGGTLREWLTHATEGATIVAVDPEHRNPERYDDWRHPDTELHVVHAESQLPPGMSAMQAHAPYQWVFIDGDHAAWAVRADVTFALSVASPGGLILLHDIVAEGHPPTPPRRYFDALTAEGFKTWEIVEPAPEWWPSENGHGIGVVEVPL